MLYWRCQFLRQCTIDCIFVLPVLSDKFAFAAVRMEVKFFSGNEIVLERGNGMKFVYGLVGFLGRCNSVLAEAFISGFNKLPNNLLGISRWYPGTIVCFFVRRSDFNVIVVSKV